MHIPVYEIVTCAMSVASGIALIICLRYLATEYITARRDWSVSVFDAARNILQFRLAVGFTVFLLGMWPIVTALWFVLYVMHRGGDGAWTMRMPWAVVPTLFGVIMILGMACIVRALIPSVWGRFGYALICGTVVVVVTASQLLNATGFIAFIGGGIIFATVARLSWRLRG